MKTCVSLGVSVLFLAVFAAACGDGSTPSNTENEFSDGDMEIIDGDDEIDSVELDAEVDKNPEIDEDEAAEVVPEDETEAPEEELVEESEDESAEIADAEIEMDAIEEMEPDAVEEELQEDGDIEEESIEDGDIGEESTEEEIEAPDLEEIVVDDHCARLTPSGVQDFGTVVQGQSVTRHMTLCNVCSETIRPALMVDFDMWGPDKGLVLENFTVAGIPVDLDSTTLLAAVAAIGLNEGQCAELDATFDTTLYTDYPGTLYTQIHGRLSDGYMYEMLFTGTTAPYAPTDRTGCFASDGQCWIDGICYGPGVRNPENSCQICDALAIDTSWSSVSDGSVCDDSDACSFDDVCGAENSCAGTAGTCAPSVTALTSGFKHNCILTDAGGVMCWGRNDDGQAGVGNTNTRIRSPRDVVNLASGVLNVSAGKYHTCAATATGTVYCWGHNGDGRLGVADIVNSSVPVAVQDIDDAVSAVAGGQFSCALLETGSVECWGLNDENQLGDGTTTTGAQPRTVLDLSGVQQITAGLKHACALLEGGTVKCWGRNVEGEVGDGTLENRDHAVDVPGVTDALSVVAGDWHTCALLSSGRVMCWGRNQVGQLACGDSTEPSPPRYVIALNDAVSLGAGLWHTCATKSDGTVQCWGYNNDGQLGNGSVETARIPKNVVNIFSGALQVDGGAYHSCALLSQGGVKCWGSGGSGQFGRGDTTSSLTPVDVIWP